MNFDVNILCLGADLRTQHLNLRRLFASDMSVRILSSSFEQQCETRMSLCRDLMILMHIITRLCARVGACLFQTMVHDQVQYSLKTMSVPSLLIYFLFFLGWSSFTWKLYNILRAFASCCLSVARILQFTVAFNTTCSAYTTKRIVSNTCKTLC